MEGRADVTYHCHVCIQSADGSRTVVGGVYGSERHCYQWAEANFPTRPGQQLVVAAAGRDDWDQIQRAFDARCEQNQRFRQWMEL